jgi:hypothetical protein
MGTGHRLFKKFSPHDLGWYMHESISFFALAQTLKLWLRYQVLKGEHPTLPFPLCETVDAFLRRVINLTYCYQVVKEC